MSEATVTPGAAKVRQYSSARWILGLLFVGNLLNFYDRQLPAIVLEQIKAEFHLDDAQAGLLASAFVIVGALAGVPLGRLADRFARNIAAHPADWHMLQPQWLADLPEERRAKLGAT